MDNALHHTLCCCRSWFDFNPYRVVEEGRSQTCNLLRHGGREEQVLPCLWQHCRQLANGVNETKVKHLVDFIKHKNFYLGQGQGTTVN